MSPLVLFDMCRMLCPTCEATQDRIFLACSKSVRGKVAPATRPPFECNQILRSRANAPETNSDSQRFRPAAIPNSRARRRWQVLHRGWTGPSGISDRFSGHDEFDAAILLPSPLRGV